MQIMSGFVFCVFKLIIFKVQFIKRIRGSPFGL